MEIVIVILVVAIFPRLPVSFLFAKRLVSSNVNFQGSDTFHRGSILRYSQELIGRTKYFLGCWYFIILSSKIIPLNISRMSQSANRFNLLEMVNDIPKIYF